MQNHIPMTSEEYIISQLSFYTDLHHHLPKIQQKWFTDKSLGNIIKSMRIVYESGETVNPFTIAKYLNRDEKVRCAILSSNCVGVPSIKNQIVEIQYNYVLHSIKHQVSAINFDGGLMEVKNQLQRVIDESQIDIGNEPKDINAVSFEVIDKITASMKRGDKLTGKSSGWAKLDSAIGGYNAGDMIVVAGRPGMGKTAIALTFAHDFAMKGGRVLFLSLEMSNEQLAKRYVSIVGQIPNGRIRNNALFDEEVKQVTQYLNNPPMTFHIDDDPDNSLQMIRGKCKLHKAKHGLDLIIIDYIQLIRVNKSHSREQEIAEISRGLKLLAKELGCTVMILAQLSRKPEERADKRPLLSDLRESGAIEQDADVVLFPFRPAYYDKEQPPIEQAELIIAKNRHGESGAIDVTFMGKLTKYTEIVI
jgi:replicative DNA helicase